MLRVPSSRGVDLKSSVVQSFAEWLACVDDGFSPASKRQFKHLKFRREDRKYTIRPVPGYLLAVNFDWRSDHLLIENLTTGYSSIFHGSHLKDFVEVMAVVPDNRYLVTKRASVTEVSVMMLDDISGMTSEICRWDFSALAIQSSMYGKGAYLSPSLMCAVNASQDSVVVLGPAEGTPLGMHEYGRPDPRQGIKCIHHRQDPPVIQECPSIGRGAAIKAVFNPCPGKEHFLTLLFTNDHDPFLDYNRPLAAGFLAIYDTQKCEYYLIARDQWVAADVLVHSRDGAFLFVRCDTECRIQMLDAESLEVKASVSHDATSFLPTFESYQFWYPFFPMMSADSLSIAVLDRNRSGNSILDAEENVTVSVYPIPFKLTRGLSLKDVCRRHIRALVPDDRHVELLPLPRPLYKYLLWQNQGASGD